jgi:thiamine-phosphate pyrophosphorylase
VTRALLSGGVDLLQLRAKNHDPATILEIGRRVRPLCREAGVPFIVNDHPEVAVALEADGVHLGQDDGSLSEARRLIQSSIAHRQPAIFLGRSTHSPEQARAALAEGFDYIGFGPLFPTPTKLGRPGIGLHGIAGVEREVGTRIPVFCIGGIKRANLPAVLAAGARRAVIVSDLLTDVDVAAATSGARQMLDGGQAAGSG